MKLQNSINWLLIASLALRRAQQKPSIELWSWTAISLWL
jgi:hypothetical protein